MESTRHSFLVGEDATRFAIQMGFEETSLSNEHSVRMWEEWAAKGFHIDGAIGTLNKQGQTGAATLGAWDGGKFEYTVHDRRGSRQTFVKSL